MALVAFIMSKAADYLVEKQEVLLVKAMHLRDKAGPSEILKEIETNKEGLGLVDSFYCICSTITTLGYGDKSFSTSGGRLFAVIWIVKEMGKITQDDIMLVMEEFEGLDVDQSGTISASDLVLAQTTEANK
ncbi:Two-pore potassium channel 1 [Linum perenne]